MHWHVSNGVWLQTTSPGCALTQPTTTTMLTTAEASAQRIYPPNVIANFSLTSVKFLSACFAGAAAGILGLENWLGFALFLSSTLFTSACIYVINCQGRPSKYLQGGITELVNPGQDNAFTFVLVWTLFYGMFDSLKPQALMG